MSRQTRQHAEIVRLCRAGSLRRALDLAAQHVADFGPDACVLAELETALAGPDVPPGLVRRFDSLRGRSAARTEEGGAR
jgi:hypothetical protein